MVNNQFQKNFYTTFIRNKKKIGQNINGQNLTTKLVVTLGYNLT